MALGHIQPSRSWHCRPKSQTLSDQRRKREAEARERNKRALYHIAKQHLISPAERRA